MMQIDNKIVSLGVDEVTNEATSNGKKKRKKQIDI